MTTNGEPQFLLSSSRSFDLFTSSCYRTRLRIYRVRRALTTLPLLSTARVAEYLLMRLVKNRENRNQVETSMKGVPRFGVESLPGQ